MKKLVLMSVLSLICLEQAQAGIFSPKVHTVTSDFDNTTTMSIKAGGLDCKGGMACPMFGFSWHSKLPNKFSIKVQLWDIYRKQYYSIKDLYLNIDGEIIQAQEFPDSTTQYEHDTTATATTSTNLFHLPLDYINKMKNAQSIKTRIVTDKGVFENTLKGAKRKTIAEKHMNLFFEELQKQNKL